MTSVIGSCAQIPNNRLYINIAPIQSTIYDATGAKAGWVDSVGALSTPGAVLLRDMGKTVYLPDPQNSSAVGMQSSIMRKVQFIPQGAAGTYGTGAVTGASSVSGAPGSATEYYTGYIRLGGQTYGGGTGVPTGVARLS